MNLRLTLPWGEKLTAAQLAVVQEYDPAAYVYPDDESIHAYQRGTLRGHINVPATALRDPRLRGIKFQIETEPLATSVYLNIEQQLSDMNDRLTQFETQPSGTATQQFNTKCSVHVPGLGLLLITQVKVENDCCTEALQKLLDDGWRILAICPQPDQRRPDYVIGRP